MCDTLIAAAEAPRTKPLFSPRTLTARPTRLNIWTGFLPELIPRERRSFSEKCFRQAAEAEESWLERVRPIPVKKSFLHSVAWSGFNREAGYSLDK